jgi:hypothetical protein
MHFLDSLVDGGKLPMFLLFLSFLVTFVLTRTITRMIRAGRGPFKDNVSGGVHIHHSVPGIILTIVGAFVSVGVDGHAPWSEVSAVMIGIGSSLVLDEFALILHLSDVYWSSEGQLSVQLVSLTVALLGLVLLGVNPIAETTGFTGGHAVVLGYLPIHIIVLLLCVEKGKYSTAAIGAFIPPVAWVGAARLARPRSRWARKRYSDSKKQTAQARAERFDSRFGQWGLDIEDLVAGKPTKPAPTSGPAPN